MPLVVTTTSRGPSDAFAPIEMFAVRLVALLNVTVLIVTSGPRLTNEPALKFVLNPVIVTVNV